MRRLEIAVPEDMRPGRADKALARLLPEVPWPALREAFSRRDVKRGSERVAPQAMVSPGDTLTLFVREVTPLQVIFEDADYLIINKPQGIPVQGDGSVEAVYLRACGQPALACHRLDANTGGLTLLAKSEAAQARAREAFAAQALRKTYHAVVRGVPGAAQAHLTAYLEKDADRARVRVFDRPVAGARRIETAYRVLDGDGESSLLEVELHTGRTHQIRAHLAHIGHPILGDDKYGDRAYNRRHGVRAQQLWATGLVLWDGRAFSVRAPFAARWKDDDD